MICLHLESLHSRVSDLSLAEEGFWKRDWEHEAYHELETHRHANGYRVIPHSAESQWDVSSASTVINSRQRSDIQPWSGHISFDSKGRKMNEKSNRNMLLVLLEVSMAG